MEEKGKVMWHGVKGDGVMGCREDGAMSVDGGLWGLTKSSVCN